MQSREKHNLIIIRLFPKENIIHSLKTIAEKHHVSTAIILSGIGQIQNPTLGFFKAKGDYTSQTFNDIYELLCLSGNIINNNNTFQPHLHAVISDEQKQTKGGHLINGLVSVTNEIVLLKTNIQATRTISNETGLADLTFTENK